ncbi:MAG: hypothetical protein Q9165_001815 [Trypethelium subeluteriae]
MSKPDCLDSRKRHCAEAPSHSQPPAKRCRHQTRGYIDTPAFWDNLSKVWLTKYALRELDRRNTAPLPLQRRSIQRTTTRGSLAKGNYSSPVLSATDNLPQFPLQHLKDIERFARRGGPDLSDLCGYPEPIPLNQKMSSSRSSSRRGRGSLFSARTSTTERTTTGQTTSTKKSKPTDENYAQNLIDGGILPDSYEYSSYEEPPAPLNTNNINRALARYRPSLSPSRFPEGAYRDFVRADKRASNENGVCQTVLPEMFRAMGGVDRAHSNILYSNIAPLTDNIAQAKPDFYYSVPSSSIRRDVRDNLSKHIVPSTETALPAAPNFFLEAKGPNGSPAVAPRQVAHDGAIGARAMQSLRTYRQNETYDNNAYTLSSTYQVGPLKMYAHHPRQPNGPGTRPEYLMHQVKGWNLTGDPETFRQGLAAYENARDWTEEQRNTFITQANTRAAAATAGSTEESLGSGSTSAILDEEQDENGLSDSETSADELARDIRSMTKRPSRALEPSTTNQGRRVSASSSSQRRFSNQTTISWVWDKGTYKCQRAGQVIRQQREVPRDAWIYRVTGRPRQRGKQWMHYTSSTGQYHMNRKICHGKHKLYKFNMSQTSVVITRTRIPGNRIGSKASYKY